MIADCRLRIADFKLAMRLTPKSAIRNPKSEIVNHLLNKLLRPQDAFEPPPECPQ